MKKLSYILSICCLMITPAIYAQDDGQAKLRPANLDFSKLEAELGAYLKSKPEDKQESEIKRVGIIKQFKKMIQKIINRSPYEGKIYLKKKSLFAKIISADDDALEVKTSRGTSKVKWESLNIRQYSEIFIAAAAAKINPDTAAEDYPVAFSKAANYYFVIAVFYDWYNNAAASKVFRKKALILNPELKSKIDQLWASAG
jgi:hypothetical protein